jgi:ribosomal protein S27AE
MREIDAIGGVSARFNRRLRCGICGFSEVRTDEVVDTGILFLAECPRCEHRWTSQQPIAVEATATPSLVTARFHRVSARLSREVQPAA